MRTRSQEWHFQLLIEILWKHPLGIQRRRLQYNTKADVTLRPRWVVHINRVSHVSSADTLKKLNIKKYSV